MKWIYVILFTGLLAVSLSPVIARVLPLVPASVIAFWRMIFASAMLWGYSSIRPQESIAPKNIRLIIAAGFLLAMHFIFWFSALKLTSIANTTVLGIVLRLLRYYLNDYGTNANLVGSPSQLF